MWWRRLAPPSTPCPEPMAEPAHIHSVTQITRRLRTLIEIQIGQVWVEGEISNCRPNKSGHVYFTLKDENA